MGFLAKLIGTFIVLGAVYVIHLIFRRKNKVPAVPVLEEKWWGPGNAQEEDQNIRPFKINVPEEVITDLKNRLVNAQPLHPPLEGVKQHYGINTNLLAKIVEYWKNKYDWKQRQEFLNQFSQFQTYIQGLNIHFIHVKPQNVPDGVEVLPLLLLHGWPGSVREFYEIIPMLTTPQSGLKFVFEVIVPSLPGYGFSDGASKVGLGPAQIAQIFNKLMLRLNFNRYYVQGGDWGSAIAQCLAVLYSKNVIAVHRNFAFSRPLFSPKAWIGIYFPWLFYSKKEIKHIYPLSEQFGYLMLESGYAHLHATKPDTVAVALRNSPVGLAAYILEKFITWTNKEWKDLEDGGLTKKFTMDQLLDNVMIYWVTGSITTSVRLYAENFTAEYRKLNIDKIPIKIPAAVNRFENEISFPAESDLRKTHLNLIHLTDFEDGGHFAAFELPHILAKDIFEFVQKVRNLSAYK